MRFYQSLKFTTPLALAFFILLSLIMMIYIDTKISHGILMKTSEEKSTELSHKLGHDIEVLLRFSDNANDMNDLLMNYLIADVNYISVYSNKQKFYESFSNVLVPGRESYIMAHYDEIMQKNITHMHYNEEYDVLQIVLRYVLPTKENEFIASRFGLVYFEYSLQRDRGVIQQNNYNNFIVSIIWSIIVLALIYMFIVVKFIRPISILSRATHDVSDHLNSFKELDYKTSIKDEIYNLFKSFNEMAFTLLKNRTALQDLNADLTQQTQKAEKASKAKSEFLANMSHEVRTPLNAIVGFIQILHKKELDDESKHYLSVMDSSSKSLLNVINDILDLSKIESGRLDIVKGDFALKTSLENIVNLYRPRMDEKNITFSCDVADDLPLQVHTDELRLKQIMGNLLSNAIKFTPEGGSVKLEASYDFHKQKIIIVVSDTGIGIGFEKQTEIFNAFSQSDTSITKDYGGTGLGLTIVKNLLQMLDGDISLESELNKGSSFTIELFAPAVTITQALDEQEPEEISFNGQKVLMVEDNKTNQMFTGIILEELNLTYDIANNGQEAVELFSKNKYSLILMDENMPVMSGTEATKEILEIEKEKNLQHTPIVALTANALKGDRDRFLGAGMDEYITKPLDTQELTQVIKTFLNS